MIPPIYKMLHGKSYDKNEKVISSLLTVTVIRQKAVQLFGNFSTPNKPNY